MPLPPPPADGFTNTGYPTSSAPAIRSASVRPGRETPGTTGTPNADTAAFAAILSPIVWIAAAGGPMNTMPACLQRRRELGVLREESVSGMDGLGTGALRGRDDGVDVEIALARRGGPDADRDVGLGDVAGTGVGVAEHRDRTDPHLAKCADHPDRDLSAVGNKNGVEGRGRHQRHIRNTP